MHGVNQMRTPNIAMIAAACGFDAIYIDLEHNPTSLETAAAICVAALGRQAYEATARAAQIDGSRRRSRGPRIPDLAAAVGDTLSDRRLGFDYILNAGCADVRRLREVPIP